MTHSEGAGKEAGSYDCYQNGFMVEGVKEEQGLVDSYSNTQHEQRSKGSYLSVMGLERRQLETDMEGNTPNSPFVGRSASKRSGDASMQKDCERNQGKPSSLYDHGDHETRTREVTQTYGKKEHDSKHDSELKAEETSTTSARGKPQTEEEKNRERSRKGRERSLRTRRRNMARLKLLEDNCVHYSKENNVLRELARSLGDQDPEKALELLKCYKMLSEGKPEPHKLSQSESYYINLLSPLSVTASTAAGETDSNALKAIHAALSRMEHPLVPSTYQGLSDKQNGPNLEVCNSIRQANISEVQTPPQEVSIVSVAGGNKVSTADLFHSVFADPAYCDDNESFGFSLEDYYDQPLLPIDEINALLEEGRNLTELPQL